MNGLMWMSERARTRPVRLIACAVVAVMALLVAAAGVTAHDPDPVFSGRWAQNQALTFSWRPGAVPGAKYQAAIKASAADASATRGSQAATFTYEAGASSWIGYGAGATCGPLGIACFTRNPPTGFTMWMREQGHPFDWGPLRWCQAYATRPNGCFDVENIMLDEFGHVEMLKHHSNVAGDSDYGDAVVQTLSRARPKVGWNVHSFGRCDVAALQLQYDMQGWGAKYSTCLDLATTLELTADAGATSSGGADTLTATLRVGDATSYVRLAGNPLALRTVRLQQRPIGAAGWLAAGTMTPGPTSGTYTATISPTTNTEYRSVFAKPANEGLGAATSSIVTIDFQPDN